MNTPMECSEYLQIKLAHFPDNVIAHYNLKNLVDEKGFAYVICECGMYGLPHAGLIAQQILEERLAKHSYHQSEHTPGFWTHEWRPICFSLIVDNFGVKYDGREHAEHFLTVPKKDYTVSDDWEGAKYAGALTLIGTTPTGRYVHMSMPGYCHEALTRFGHQYKNSVINHTAMSFLSTTAPSSTLRKKTHRQN